MRYINLTDQPNQTQQVVLAGQNCSIELRTLDGYAVDNDTGSFDNSAQYLTFTLDVSGVNITRNQNCLNLKRLLLNRQYLGFVGDFMFVDTQPPVGSTGNDPQYAGLGTRYQLVYIEAADLAAVLGS